jgi:hypothetical protein
MARNFFAAYALFKERMRGAMRLPVLRPVRYLFFFAILMALLSVVHVEEALGAGHDHADEMSGHMTMTTLRPQQPGDETKAGAIVLAARKAADQYTDYRKALADGFTIFMPNVPQKVYHFTNNRAAAANTFHFDASRPTSLLYEKVPGVPMGEAGAYKLLGVMYTAPYRSSEEELNQRIPLSIAQWHVHTNLCLPIGGDRADLLSANAKFGLRGSITTADACRAAGGRFLPHVFGWMVHVYPYERDPKKMWAAGMDDDHEMQHDAMPMGAMSMDGMKM